MSPSPPMTPDQIEELLALRAAEGLDAASQTVYDELLAADPSVAERAESMELAAAGACVALLRRHGGDALPLPGAVRERVLARAGERSAAVVPPALALAQPGPPATPKPNRSPLISPAALGWYVAAAAAVALMFYIAADAPPKPVNVSPGQKYATLKADPATVAAEWDFNTDGGDRRYANANGEVIFNPQTQTGYMKIVGLPVNDPAAQQYQLWIVDATRTGNENTDRVDGGVFDITDAGEAIIPIDAKIDARQPVVFAITVEKPGGVVESKGPLHVIAVVE